MFGRSLREYRRKKVALVELRNMCYRYNRECGPVTTYKLAPGEVDKIVTGKKLLEDCIVIKVNGKSIKRAPLKTVAKQKHKARK